MACLVESDEIAMEIVPFRIDFPDAQLGELRDRIGRTSWPESIDDAEGRYGLSQDRLRPLAHQWASFDWREIEGRMNALPQFRATIDGQPIHFLKIPARTKNATPLILTHGWPWTFWDMRKLIAPLTDPEAHGGTAEDGFELVIASLPGFAFSTPARAAGINFWQTADLWHKLMTEALGFQSYGASGGDWGAMVSAQLGHKYADRVIAAHLTQMIPLDRFSAPRPWRFELSGNTPALRAFERRFASHLAVQVIEPQTLAYGLQDSPVGLLAWLMQRWLGWSGAASGREAAIDDRQMLANATLYWASGALASSLRYYANAAHDPWQPSHPRTPRVEAPIGVSLFGGDLPSGIEPEEVLAKLKRPNREPQYNIVHTGAHLEGGHFAHYENPGAVVADIRATFRAARRLSA